MGTDAQGHADNCTWHGVPAEKLEGHVQRPWETQSSPLFLSWDRSTRGFREEPGSQVQGWEEPGGPAVLCNDSSSEQSVLAAASARKERLVARLTVPARVLSPPELLPREDLKSTLL